MLAKHPWIAAAPLSGNVGFAALAPYGLGDQLGASLVAPTRGADDIGTPT